MSAPSVAVTSLAIPGNFAGVLQSGGSIPDGESRWYRIVAMDATSVSAVRRHSSSSSEIGPFVAGGGLKKVALTWDAVAGALSYRVYCRTSAAPNLAYDETVPNALGAAASVSFSTTTGLTFTDQVAALVCKRPFFGLGIVRAVMTSGDSATPGTFRTFYDAIVAAAPANAQLIIPAGFCSSVTGPYFSLAAFLEISDAANTQAYFLDRDSCVFIVGGWKVVGNGASVSVIMGEYDPATGRRSRGSAVYCGGYGTSTRPTTSGVSRINLYGATAELNDSYVEDIGFRGMFPVTGNGVLSGGADPSAAFGNDGLNLPITLRGTEVAGLNTNTNLPGQITPATVQDLFVRQCYAAYTYSVVDGQLFSNLTIEDSEVGLFCRIPSPATFHRFINLRVLGRTEADITYQVTAAARRAILRDPTFGNAANDEDPLLKQIASVVGSTLEWESLVEVEVIDAQGAAVSGETVSILDVSGAVLASGITDATGVVVGGMPVSYLVYTSLVTGALAAALMSAHVAAAKWSKTDRRPLTLQIAGSDGVETFTLPFSPIGSVSYRVKVHADNASGIAGEVARLELGGACGPLALVGVVELEDVG